MNILLISPLRNPLSRSPKTLIIPQLGLHLLEGLSGPQHQVRTIEEEINDINLDDNIIRNTVYAIKLFKAIKPLKHMTPFEHQECKKWIKKEFSKISFTLKRFPHNLFHPLLHLAVNFATRNNVKSDYRKLYPQDLEIFQSKIYGIV